MTLNWTDYAGRSVGAWRLDSFLGFRDGRASYRSFEDNEESSEQRPVVLQMVSADDDSAGIVGRSWEHANACSDDHLLRVFETGEVELDGARVIYAVVEQPDVEIGEVLAGRPLNPDEVRSLTLGAAGALDCLHKRGLQHGSVTPFHMYVVGDAVKLSVDTISAAEGSGWESDMQRLGKTLVQAMMGTGKQGDANTLPAPFRAIATGCMGVGGRPWTAHRVLQTLSGNALADPEKVAAPRVERVEADDHRPRRWPLIATAAAVVLGFFGYWWSTAPVKAPTPVVVRKQVEEPAPIPAVKSSPMPTPNATRARTVAPAPARPVKATGSQTDWAVIAATYANREAAQKRADSITKRSPKIQAHVFTAPGATHLSYVVLGSGLTQDQAEHLRRTARQAGAPGDSYVTKLKEK